MTQRLDPRSDRPLALQLADLLRAEIQEGHRRPGSQLPTESEFQHAYGVSRTTVRAALATLASEGLVLTRRMLMIGRGPVPADIAAWLGISAGEDVVIRQRLQLLDDVPAVVSMSYYPLWVADGTRLESSAALPEGPDNLIERLGHRFARGTELLAARMPTPDEVRLLELDPGVPVVRMLHIDYDPDGRTLQVADDLYAADRHEFAFEWAEPDGAP